MPEVLFAGYKMPHPLEPRIQVKVQTQQNMVPETIVDKCIGDLLVSVRRLEDSFQVRSSGQCRLRSPY